MLGLHHCFSFLSGWILMNLPPFHSTLAVQNEDSLILSTYQLTQEVNCSMLLTAILPYNIPI